MDLASGTRLRCERCGSEAIIVKPAPADLSCCGMRLTTTFVPGARPAEGTPGHG